MKQEDANRLGTDWAYLIDGNRWPFETPNEGDTFTWLKTSFRRHLMAFVPDCEHAAAVDTDNGPAVVAFDGEALYVVTAHEVLADKPPTILSERFPLSEGVVRVRAFAQPDFGTMFRTAYWRFTVALATHIEWKTETHLNGEARMDELLARAVAAQMGYTLPPEADGVPNVLAA